jgi:uncharacterized membrane protein YfcA
VSAAILFALILVASLLFTMLGLGGGTVYVPILHWFGLDLKTQAVPLGLALNLANTGLALIPFSRAGLVGWRAGSPVAIAAVCASPAGAYAVRFMPERAVALVFAAVAAIVAVQVPGARPHLRANRSGSVAALAGAGAAAGFLGGLLGIGGGFLVGPFLISGGFEAKRAAATTAYVVTASSLSGFLGHAGSMRLPLGPSVLAVIAVVLGSQTGAARLIRAKRTAWLRWTYALVLLAVAARMIVVAMAG